MQILLAPRPDSQLWHAEDSADDVALHAETLQLSPALAAGIAVWGGWRSKGRAEGGSGRAQGRFFIDAEEERRFYDAGVVLWRQLRAEQGTAHTIGLELPGYPRVWSDDELADLRLDQPAGEIGVQDVIPDDVLSEPAEDAFRHRAIAARAADLITRAAPPLNLALFGPWGSGKSSLAALLGVELRRRYPKRRGRKPRLVLYNAWKYGGESLQRNFVSSAAGQLGLKTGRRWRNFHRGLYESRRTIEFSRSRMLSGLPFALFLGVIFFAVFALLAVGAMELAEALDHDVGAELKKQRPQAFFTVGVLSFITVLVGLALRAGSAEIDQSAPSASEEFSERFEELIDTVRRSRHPWPLRWLRFLIGKDDRADRVIFFVDELDRCSDTDIVGTLAAIRAFLDQDHCVFIVAADRDVLEQALRRAPQPTPSNETSPYYSSASAYLDKIFQYQLELPPLRGRRLSRYASDLVDKRIAASVEESSLWREIAESEVDNLLQLVIYALVPSHVRSPRRVKVLLNHFVMAARVAEARGVQWPARAPEIAKLVALRTEFPSFAEDLFREPHLPTYYLRIDEVPEHKVAQVRRLVRYHKTAAAPARMIDAAPGEVPNTAVVAEHRAQLRRYLQRTSEIADPGFDLLYLEAAGHGYGLDPGIGDLIERDAPDVPDEVAEVLANEPEAVQRAAARLLADMVLDSAGPERRQIMVALMAVVQRLDPIGDVVAPVTRALNTFRSTEELGEEHLLGALRVALEKGGASDDPDSLIETLFRDARLLDDPDRTIVIARWSAALSDRHLRPVQRAAAGFLPADVGPLLAPVASLPTAYALRFLDSEEIWAAIGAYVGGGEEDPTEKLRKITSFAEQFLNDVIRPRENARLAFFVLHRLLEIENPAVYRVANEHADAILKDRNQSLEERRNLVLLGWAQAPSGDWPTWHRRLTELS